MTESRAFIDASGRQWSAFELELEPAPASLLFFVSGRDMLVAWGHPINWRDPANMHVLFALARPMPPEAMKALGAA